VPDAPVYFLLHIPKTAGQTIQLHLEEHCAAGRFWGVADRRAAPPAAPARVRAVAGHGLRQSLERIFAGREIRRVVLLRDPLGLQLSLYNYRMMNYLAKGLGTYGFELHLRAQPRDWIAHLVLADWLEIPWARLLAMPQARKYDLLNEALARFWFVGAHSDCDRLLAALAPDLEVPGEAPPRNTAREWRRQTGWRPLAEEELAGATRSAFRARNPLDHALWESWRDAGFAPRTVRPGPLDPAQRGGFRAHELARPVFYAVRLLRRDGRLRRRIGIAPGDAARDARDWPAAVRRYRAALAEMPDAPAIWVQYGHALKETGDIAAAEAAYRRSLALDPDTADTHLQLGHALKMQDRIAEAAAAYRRALQLDPGQPAARDELAALDPAVLPDAADG
jgi:tetratricopeptide (TPR) repeat protein